MFVPDVKGFLREGVKAFRILVNMSSFPPDILVSNPHRTSTFIAGEGPLNTMVPAHKHSQTEPSVSTGIPSTNTLLGGSQGSTTMGMQGAGIGTPNAAAVSAMTIGLRGLWQRINPVMLRNGTMSKIVATGRSLAKTPTGSTIRKSGASPMSHSIIVPRTAIGPGMG